MKARQRDMAVLFSVSARQLRLQGDSSSLTERPGTSHHWEKNYYHSIHNSFMWKRQNIHYKYSTFYVIAQLPFDELIIKIVLNYKCLNDTLTFFHLDSDEGG